MYIRVEEMSMIAGYSISSGKFGSSSRRRAGAVMSGMMFFTKSRSLFPVPWLNSQVMKACSRYSLALEQRGQSGEVAGVRSWSLTLVISNLCRSLKLKLVRSLPRPFNLHSLQHRDQSVLGLWFSTLQGLNCLLAISVMSMVRFSSISTVDHSFMDMVLTFTGFSRYNFFQRRTAGSKAGSQGLVQYYHPLHDI